MCIPDEKNPGLGSVHLHPDPHDPSGKDLSVYDAAVPGVRTPAGQPLDLHELPDVDRLLVGVVRGTANNQGHFCHNLLQNLLFHTLTQQTLMSHIGTTL